MRTAGRQERAPEQARTSTATPASPWVKHRRDDARSRRSSSRVTIMKSGIRFGGKLMEPFKDATRVTLLYDTEQKDLLGFRFHSDEGDRDAYKMGPHGGSPANRRSPARFIACSLFVRGTLKMTETPLRLVPKADESPVDGSGRPMADKIWYVKLPKAAAAAAGPEAVTPPPPPPPPPAPAP